MNVFKGLMYALFASCLIFTTACSSDDDMGGTESKGQMQFEITDAPIDDAKVKGAFVTVSNVKVDGQDFAGFSGKQTIDLMAYQNGNTKAMGLGEVDAKSYSSITLELDYATDANGNSPGCYILTDDNSKVALTSSTRTKEEITINQGDFDIEENQMSSVVLDFDLRKAVKYDGNDNSSFKFVSKSELESSLRFVSKSESGQISGKVDEGSSSNTKIVAFAYAKGTFNRDTELQGQGEGSIRFKNAVTSGKADGQGNYTLAFLSEGEYEVVFGKFEDSDNDGTFELEGTLELNATGDINFNSIKVESGSQVIANATITGILPF